MILIINSFFCFFLCFAFYRFKAPGKISLNSLTNMCNAEEVVLAVTVYVVEILAIILGNAATIVVFWKRRSQLKRTSYLLINLAIADLMVGVSNIESVVGEIWKLNSSNCKSSWRNYVVLDVLFECASIDFLVLISLERLYAIVCPFRLRATATRKYLYSIGAVWLMSTLVPVFKLVNVFTKVTERTVSWVQSMHACTCLLMISCAYSLIWFFSKKQDPRLPINRQKQNKKLAKTLFIVTVLSLITWLPFTVIHVMRFDVKIFAPGSILFDVPQFLQIGNSLINPIIYCLRMPEYKSTLKTVFSRQKYPRLQFPERQKETNGVVLLRVTGS